MVLGEELSFSALLRDQDKFTSFKVLVINVRYSKRKKNITLQFILNQFKRFYISGFIYFFWSFFYDNFTLQFELPLCMKCAV